MGPNSGEPLAADQEADRLEKKVGAIRDNLDGLVSELGHRRSMLSRRYLKPAAIALAIGGAAAIGGFIWYRASRKKPTRMDRLRVAFGRILAHPERVAAPPPPSVGKRIAAAAAGAAVSIIARRLASAALPPARSADQAVGT
jgi:hypothetical protein